MGFQGPQGIFYSFVDSVASLDQTGIFGTQEFSFWYHKVTFCDQKVIFWYQKVTFCDQKVIFLYQKVTQKSLSGTRTSFPGTRK